jgi:outer membrane receptor protein involved in Fe transport
VFRNWYKDIQFGYFRLAGGLLEAYIANPSDAELFGGELEITALVGDRLTLNASAGLTDLTYKNVRPEAPAPLLLGDARPENVPKAKINGGFTYEQPVGGAGDLALRVDYSWQSSTVLIDYVQIAPNQRNRTIQPSYGVGTARLTYTPSSGGWQAYLHADNLFDKRVETTRFNYNGIVGALYNRPREIRAGVRLTF